MMIKPGITELDRCVDSRYTLVSMVAKRARMIGKERYDEEMNDETLYSTDLDKPVTQAVNEIANGVVGYVRSEAITKAREYEEEKLEAISQLEREMGENAALETENDAAANDGETPEEAAEASAAEYAEAVQTDTAADGEAEL